MFVLPGSPIYWLNCRPCRGRSCSRRWETDSSHSASRMIELWRKIDDWCRWDSLRKLGSSPLVRSSLAFAAAGYLLLWNANVQEYLTIKFDSHFSLWRIWMIYYGGISIAVATALYSY